MNTLNTYVIARRAAVECRIGHYLRNTEVLKTLSRRSTERFEKKGRNTYVRRKLPEYGSNEKKKGFQVVRSFPSLLSFRGLDSN